MINGNNNFVVGKQKCQRTFGKKSIWSRLSRSDYFYNLIKCLYPTTWHQHFYALKGNSLRLTAYLWLFPRREGGPQAVQDGSEVTQLKGLCYSNVAAGQHLLPLLLFFQKLCLPRLSCMCLLNGVHPSRFQWALRSQRESWLSLGGVQRQDPISTSRDGESPTGRFCMCVNQGFGRSNGRWGKGTAMKTAVGFWLMIDV